MSAGLVIGLILTYFLVLIGVSYLTGGKGDNDAFFLGNRNSPWYIVAFGMIGASLSGVTFISIPGWVEASSFSYMQVVLGYVVGYAVIIKVLLPLYYKLQLTSIYSYLESRFGVASYKTGASFFMISRIIGAAFRLYLVAVVLQYAVFDAMDLPFWVTVAVTILLIWVYTFRSGIKTIVWTDTLQTTFMLLAVVLTVLAIKKSLIPDESLISYIAESNKSQIFFWENWQSSKAFWKNFASGAFITIVMTGLDQDMMQKNLSCRSLGDAQKNMFWLSIILVFVNLIFLSLGVLLYDYADVKGISEVGDKLYPAVALSGDLGIVVAILFIVGLIAAAYSSADSALTALTTSFCVDILGEEKMQGARGKNIRKVVHLGLSIVLMLVIIVYRYLVDDSVIKELFTIAGYTYGPLLGLYAFGMFTKWNVRDKAVPVVAVLSPVITYLIKYLVESNTDYRFNFELLIINGLLMFAGLLMLVKRK
mgnify:CR=1 FL=1